MHDQIFGPCAIPFSLEKQTLLRAALPSVLERDINVNIVLIKEVRVNFTFYGSVSYFLDFLDFVIIINLKECSQSDFYA